MKIFTDILTQLGVNHTIWIQLCFFLISYVFLSRFLFRPYMANLEYRKKNTGGNVEEATRLNQAAERLAMDYQGHVKKQNEKAAAIYEKLKKEGQLEEEKLVGQARAQATDLIEQTRKKISDDMGEARENLRAQIPQLSQLIASRVLGRELS